MGATEGSGRNDRVRLQSLRHCSLDYCVVSVVRYVGGRAHIKFEEAQLVTGVQSDVKMAIPDAETVMHLEIRVCIPQTCMIF